MLHANPQGSDVHQLVCFRQSKWLGSRQIDGSVRAGRSHTLVLHAMLGGLVAEQTVPAVINTVRRDRPRFQCLHLSDYMPICILRLSPAEHLDGYESFIGRHIHR